MPCAKHLRFLSDTPPLLGVQKKPPLREAFLKAMGRLPSAAGETVAAQNRTTAFARLERNLALSATLGANSVMHFTRSVVAPAEASLLALLAASGATLRSRELLGSVELLFTFRERELCLTVAARKSLIRHDNRKERNKRLSFLSTSADFRFFEGELYGYFPLYSLQMQSILYFSPRCFSWFFSQRRCRG